MVRDKYKKPQCHLENLEVTQNYLIRVNFCLNHRVYEKFGPVRVFPRD